MMKEMTRFDSTLPGSTLVSLFSIHFRIKKWSINFVLNFFIGENYFSKIKNYKLDPCKIDRMVNEMTNETVTFR